METEAMVAAQNSDEFFLWKMKNRSEIFHVKWSFNAEMMESEIYDFVTGDEDEFRGGIEDSS